MKNDDVLLVVLAVAVAAWWITHRHSPAHSCRACANAGGPGNVSVQYSNQYGGSGGGAATGFCGGGVLPPGSTVGGYGAYAQANGPLAQGF
jgi:hypothetical protein